MEVKKRNGNLVPFDKDKIVNAILKSMKQGSGIVKEKVANASVFFSRAKA